MKANRKFLKNDEDAVSPVIAVILMVAITVVLAATVYVWVSGFGASNSAPAKSIALTSAGALDTTNHVKGYTVASASPGLKFSDLTYTIGGVALACPAANAPGEAAANTAPADNQVAISKDGGTTWADCDALIGAGDLIRINDDASLSGAMFRMLDTQSNSIVYTLTVQ
ncbi:MAG TPA: archaellin/type IV pilin N-terminal domain-containing protein [Candidatus Thermoplasmatota archaeon]|nr:archaellin/type IV pilin N-terminal domain-containing protein [Candidatus Thermoplasmatota archaeon]